MLKPLPIDAHLSSICQYVRDNPITIVEAPPGTGKTTRVAPALMDLPFAAGQKIYLLQPRRIAAKSVGERIAWEQGSRIGERIGYQVRFDSQVSRETQLIVATEGVLLRKLQDDAGLSDTSIVLLDEFHERSLDSDLLLGMLRRVQQALRDDLKIVIMSATIDSHLIQSQLDGAPIVRVESPNFPVAIRYRPTRPEDSLSDRMVDAIRDVAEMNDGDVLAFLPGMGEIQRTFDALSQTRLGRDCEVMQLFGGMTLEDQARAIEPGTKRRIILSTNVAETSLTLEGIRIVVDSGLARVMRFSPDVGLDRLALENISQASAAQRAGRAGRVAPGICYRLWSDASERARSAFLEPEIRRVDIVSAVLQLFAWGEGESDDFPWLEQPRSDSVARARSLLEQLGAIAKNKITEIGKAMSRLPTHPRLARMVIAGFESGCYERTCMMAALLSERDPFQQSRTASTRSAKRWDSDCVERLVALENFLDGHHCESPFGTLHRTGVRSIVNAAQQLQEQCTSVLKGTSILRERQQSHAPEVLMKTMLFGYPDRLAKRRSVGKPHGLMVGGKGVALSHQSGVTEAELFLCIDIDAGAGDAAVRQASRIDLDWLPKEQVLSSEELFFHPSQKQVVARRHTKWLDLVLNETPTAITDMQHCAEILWREALKNWEQAFPIDDDRVQGLVERVNCLRLWLPDLELPELGESFLQDVAKELCQDRRSLTELRAAPWIDWIQSRFASEQWQAIEKEAPAKIQVPSGSWIKIQYALGKPPTMAVKIQEVFSMKATPRIAKGRVPLLLHLLSPNMRPQQITEDLASFWANGYPIVKKELKRRYPKHSWPDDPTTAIPGRR
ncbi:MAG: ATP-dependent helicase HrpB [Planctomycetota bacterium]|nr:ATP-dependent helicase HrpB [Planctomycetota bacterium]